MGEGVGFFFLLLCGWVGGNVAVIYCCLSEKKASFVLLGGLNLLYLTCEDFVQIQIKQIEG